MTTFPSKHGIDDLTLLKEVSNDGINDNLQKRFAKDIIYTYIGHVLISVNPFKEIKNLYTDQTLLDYRGKYRYEMPPHVYSLADDMYRSMVSNQQNQCVIISGESGAGKTEASKKILQYVAAISGRSREVSRVKDVILESNPLLEAFGNAKTIRNNNSSRFGKYMEIQFDRAGDPRGGRITNYLLEKSRVVFQTESERCFHVFYQLLKGADANLKAELRLQEPSYYWYLNQGKCYDVHGIDDVAEFKDTDKAMDTMGFTPQEKVAVWRLLASILFLGQVNFAEVEADRAGVSNEDALDMFAWLLQCDKAAVNAALLTRTITTGNAATRGRVSVVSVPLKVDEAYYSRDALAKAIYSRLFDYIVSRVNDSLGWSQDDCTLLGVLDIYGFEIFEQNGFEQLCINFVNEKLQQIFINLTLKEEQDEYARENIEWEPIQFFNNKICCDLIESKQNPIGVFTLLDDTCNFPKGTDEKFVQKMSEVHSQHAHWKAQGPAGFEILHYAGPVQYAATGMCDKNKDTLFDDHIIVCQRSQSPLLVALFPDQTGSKARPTTASFKIKESIGILVAALSKCQPHYIRCLKPNDKKQRDNYDTPRCVHQIKYLGLLENVKVRRAGYAYRNTYDKFLYRYAICCEKTWPVTPWEGRFKEGTTTILDSLNLEGKKPYSCGTTKIFVRAPETIFTLEEMRERKTFTYACKLQRFFVKNAMQNYYYKLKKTANDKLRDNKDRRKNSLNREYIGDYINYRENFALKGIVGKDAKVHFADVVNYLDKKGKICRYCFVISDLDVVIVRIAKNKDKNTKKQKPLIYEAVHKIDIKNLKAIQFSKLADNFFLLQVDGVTPFCENRRKTEILALLLRAKPELNVIFNNDFNVIADAKKPKPVLFQFASTPGIPPNGQFLPKKHRCNVAPELGANAYPNLKEPETVSHTYSSSLSTTSTATHSTGPPPSSARPFAGGASGGGPAPFSGGSSPPPPVPATSREGLSNSSYNNTSNLSNSSYNNVPPQPSSGPSGGSSPPFGARGPPPFGGRGSPPFGGAPPGGNPTPAPPPRSQPNPGPASGRPLPGAPVFPTGDGGGGGGDIPEWKRKLMERKNQ